MPRLEMEINSPKRQPYNKLVLLAELPDVDGTYTTATGDITIALKTNELVVISEMLKGFPSRHRGRRLTRKRVSLRSGNGAQTVSKRERLHVGPIDKNTQIHLPLGNAADIPEWNRQSAIERLNHSMLVNEDDEQQAIEEWNKLSS